ncbi:adenine-specific DNA-methyltransferase [Caloramator quimbayensis]|uniref:site-specific DNA-methyltransferase (adenine-specific) n=1 Tax=Caloramator quimbayensis TaxID=1147123 RepID=A0A1T4WRF3_9CLOT|nr:N-6 DNA methylase [Caloramator quimbayensis]SKA79687.1 adenine-specific DNA-methyltransferase [Caloramator quimbayensis]
MIKEFKQDVKSIYESIINFKDADIEGFKQKWDVKNYIADVYQTLSKKELKKETGSFYTPIEIVEFMTDRIVEEINFNGKLNFKIVDPSCGGGYFLIRIFEKLKEKMKSIGTQNIDEHIIKNNIYGYDIDEYAVMITVIELYERGGYVPKNIILGDFLTSDLQKFDIVIGNPPYMGHKILTGEYRSMLYEMYGEVFSDKADLSYCFIKKSIDALNERGRLVFITSRYMLEALNAEGIRRYIKNKIRIKSIVDFYGIRLIKGAGVDNIIIDFVKDDKIEDIEYFRLLEKAKGKGKRVFQDINDGRCEFVKNIMVNANSLEDNGWIFLSKSEREVLNKIKGICISDICESFQGIITGCDKAFVLKKDLAKKLNIEENLLKPWIKSSNIEKFMVMPSDDVIIYSNIIDDINKYEKAINFIERFKPALENRRECRKGVRKWYELQWGRDESIFENEKIIFPYKSSSNRFSLDFGSYFSADVYMIKIRDMFLKTTSYKYLCGVLNSSIYEFYIKSMAKKLGDNMYEYYPNKIMSIKIPQYIKEIEDEVNNFKEDTIYRIDMILCKTFGITEDEYDIIRSWCS